MSFYENLVTQAQMNYSRYYSVYAAGNTPAKLSKRRSIPYQEQISGRRRFLLWGYAVFPATFW